ncbi:hypothetical protein ASC97_31915 [Rhizobium sp. Root1203]|uniref:hypothetical protein n=1 Tax=Rhizobium sp. Root1203 TaxID=1736427 RepID=UPI00070D23B4|nr:hypothetical protein [Rhizobium sp. Root1203]KQV13716.1 hypothetical protein ASC97_31915 [Rhizobium sp. Root1203]
MNEEKTGDICFTHRRPVGELVDNIMQSVLGNGRIAQIEDVGPSALWRDARLLVHPVYVDNGSDFVSERVISSLADR